MRARFKGAYAVLGVGALLLVLVTARAQTPCPMGGAGQEHKEGRFKERLTELNLTPAQMEQLNTQRQANKSAMRELQQALKTKRRELREELDKQKPDKGKLESITSELKRLEAQRIDQRVKNILQMKETLTPEQFKKMSSLKEERRGEKHGQQRGKGHWRGHGDEQREKPQPVPTQPEKPAGGPAVSVSE
ncbi:MAG: periplasmic heavy metal sensor [Candidatus Aureabacteria bacterium]|nr:periplasmic heavy metal sensor [Candidatus Auribacterota bacterium]